MDFVADTTRPVDRCERHCGQPTPGHPQPTPFQSDGWIAGSSAHGELSDRLQRSSTGGRSILDGQPAALAVPFDAQLLELGLHRRLAVSLYEQQLLTLAESAKLADLPVEQFLTLLCSSGVDVVDYPAEEVGAELEALR